MRTDVELLAPAGSFEILKAVIAAGANAVYLGGSKFGARAYANNFTEEEMLEALDYAHLRGVKIYLTVNTLLKNKELTKELYDYLLPFYKAGLDAVLVQDFGVLDFIRRHFPDLAVHASTQMTVMSKESALYLKSLGVSRVVVSRELSLSEIKEIYNATHMEIEAFVHGALCYSYSGMCLFSSLLGGRSGNRGRCAQPCRLPYRVLDSDKTIKKESFMLSLKDLSGIGDLEELVSSGVCSLKIEGRMKQLPYAYGVTRVYRNALDNGLIDREQLLNLGNRGGFTDSYYHMHNDNSMITYGDSSLHNGELCNPTVEELKLKVKGHAVLKIGKPSSFEVTMDVNGLPVSYTAYGNTVDAAQKRPLIKGEVEERFRKTGDTSFSFSELCIEMDEAVFIPNGALNSLRRDALAGLENLLLSHRERKVKPCECFHDLEWNQNFYGNSSHSDQPVYIASVSFLSQLDAIADSNCIQTVYLGLELYGSNLNGLKEDINRLVAKEKKVYLRLPSVFRNDAAKNMEANRDFINGLPIEGLIANSLDAYAFCLRVFPKFKRIVDFGLYTFNDYAVFHFLKENNERICAPLELNRSELQHRRNDSSEIMIYGRYPLMQTANCTTKNTKGCTGKPEFLTLTDRKNADFPVLNHCPYCYNTVFNSLPTNLLPVMNELKDMGFWHFRLHFTDESSEEIHTILRCLSGEIRYNQNKTYTYGHYKRGVE